MKIDFEGSKTWVQILALVFDSCLSLSELHYLSKQSANLTVK